MDFDARLRRITDLFVEGTEVYLGDDPNGDPVLIWVNKLNSFEVEEARRDGSARRGLRLAELATDTSPERQAVQAEVRLWDDNKLQEHWVGQKIEEIYLEVITDIDADEKWAENLVLLRRLPTLLDESEAPDDDPRRQQLADIQTAYFAAIREGQEKKQKQALKEAAEFKREDLEGSFFESWRQRITLDEFMEERRVTELFYALRECVATRVGIGKWDHSGCRHGEKMLERRELVRQLPDGVSAKCIDALEELTTPQREAGNSDAPSNSSGSSGPQNEPEAATPSIPEEMPAVAHTS